jgi:hypothetical protein
MATNPPPAPAPAPAPANDWAAATKHLAAVKAKVFEYAGKPGMNPYLWWDKVQGSTLEKAVENKVDSLYKEVLALKFEEPKAPSLGVKLRKPTPRP